MSEVVEYKCPACGAPLRFDAGKQMLVCDSCDSEFTEEEIKNPNANPTEEEELEPTNIDWKTQSFMEEHETMGEQDGFICESCGAEIVSDGNTAATECMYCGNPVVLSARVEGMLTPDAVIPFKITKEQAKEKLMEFYSGKPLLPDAFKDDNRIKKITGMYVPFWLFSCTGDGKVNYLATKVRTWSDGSYRYTETRRFSVMRAGNVGFELIPVDASDKMDDNYMDGLEPFDYSEIVDFNPMYMAGYFADKFDVDVDTCSVRANERVENTVKDKLKETVVGYTSVTPTAASIKIDGQTIKYGLFPVWMLNTKYGDKMYQFAINGQTGEIAGELPIDKGKLWKWRLLITAIATVPVALIASLFF